MELFKHAKAVRLKSRHDKFLYADEDELHVTQDRKGSSLNARWTVEAVPHAPGAIRLKSRYGRYLAASSEAFLLGMTGRKVNQAAPAPGGRPDASLEWEPVRDGFQARFKSRLGGVGGSGSKYLRANGGVPPWRNSVTHDVPRRTNAQDWVLWDVEIVEVLTPGPATPAATGPERAESAPATVLHAPESPSPTSQEAHCRPTKSRPTSPPPPEYAPPPPPTTKPEPKLSKLEPDPIAMKEEEEFDDYPHSFDDTRFQSAPTYSSGSKNKMKARKGKSPEKPDDALTHTVGHTPSKYEGRMQNGVKEMQAQVDSSLQPHKHALKFPIAKTNSSSLKQGIKGRLPHYVGHFHDDTRGLKFCRELYNEQDMTRLQIPPAFVEEFESNRRLRGEVKLLLGGACSVSVQASELRSGYYLTEGWSGLVQSVPLQLGDNLMFEVVDGLIWSLVVFNDLGVQVRFVCHAE